MTEPARAGRPHSCCGTCNGPETRLGLAAVNHGQGRDSQGRAHRIELLPDQLLTYSGEHQTPVVSFNPTVTQIVLFKFSGPKNNTSSKTPVNMGDLWGGMGEKWRWEGKGRLERVRKNHF